ncbi:hypothetical protein MTO96_030401 [Rhipicephalus appendiculatus]
MLREQPSHQTKDHRERLQQCPGHRRVRGRVHRFPRKGRLATRAKPIRRRRPYREVPLDRQQPPRSPSAEAGSPRSTRRDTGRRDEGNGATKSPKNGPSGTTSTVSRSPANREQSSSVSDKSSPSRKSAASIATTTTTSAQSRGSTQPAGTSGPPRANAGSPLSTSRDTGRREEGHGATKTPKNKGSPGMALPESRSPANKGQSLQASGTTSTGCSSEARSTTATTTSTPSRGSTRPAGVPRSPLAEPGSAQSTIRDSSQSRKESTPRDIRESSTAPISSVSQAGSQGPSMTSYATASQAGSRTPSTAPYVTAPSTYSQAGSQEPSTAPFVTAPSTSNTPTRAPYVSASAQPPHSVEPRADVATARLHSKSPATEESKSRSRGSSARSPRSTSSKQGAASGSRGSGATRGASRSPRSEHKSPEGEPTTSSALPSAAGKSAAVGGARGSGGSKLDSSAQARKDKGPVKSAASSPVTASPDDSLLGYAKGQDLVALSTTPTQASLDKMMTAKSGVRTPPAVGGDAEASEASFQDRLLRHLQISRTSSIGSKKKTATAEEKQPGAPKHAVSCLRTSMLTFCELGVCVSLVIMVATVAILWKTSSAAEAAALAARSANASGDDTAHCGATECVQLNELLNASIDRDADPCRDLHQYVCGGWRKRFPGMSWRANHTFVDGDALRRSKLLYAGVAGKAALVFDSCQDVLIRADHNITHIAQVLRTAGLQWPHVSSKMDLLKAMGFMDQTLDWAVFFAFERVPRSDTTCRRSNEAFYAGRGKDYVVRVKVSRHFLPLQRLVADMVLQSRFDSYLELLFVTLVNQTLRPMPLAENTRFAETEVAPDLAEAARNITSQPLCTSTDGVIQFTPWLTSSDWQHFLANLFQLDPYGPAYLEIMCPELFTMFFGRRLLGSSRSWGRPLAGLMVSWYALQTCLMFAYAPVIEMMYPNRTVAVEAHKRTCLELSSSFSGSSYGFLSLPRDKFSSAYWESRFIINRVTDSFLGEYISPNWRSNNATAIALLSLNRLTLSLLARAVNVVLKWSTFYPERLTFVDVWKWASSSRVSDVYLRRNKGGNISCCVRRSGVSALVPPRSTADGGRLLRPVRRTGCHGRLELPGMGEHHQGARQCAAAVPGATGHLERSLLRAQASM